MADSSFWNTLDQLLASSQIVIDRPKGTPHPRFPNMLYPLDYGYLAGTMSVDGGGIDVWVGSEDRREAKAVICTVDLLKRDIEVKVLFGCSEADVEAILRFVEVNSMGCILVRR